MFYQTPKLTEIETNSRSFWLPIAHPLMMTVRVPKATEVYDFPNAKTTRTKSLDFYYYTCFIGTSTTDWVLKVDLALKSQNAVGAGS